MVSNATINNRSAMLKTQIHELTKTFIVFDGQNRPIEVYTAPTDLPDGRPCLVTYYEYVSPTDSNIVKRKEDEGVWVTATMDI